MRVEVAGKQNTLKFEFLLDEGDGQYTDTISMAAQSFTVTTPENVTVKDVHPDHLALIALLVAHPFVGSSLAVPWTVSERFAASCSKILTFHDKFYWNQALTFLFQKISNIEILFVTIVTALTNSPQNGF